MIALRNRVKHAFSLVVLLCLIADIRSVSADEHVLVLVVDKSSPIEQLDRKEARLLFMNKPVSREGRRLIPIMNNQDKILHEVFLQKLMFMSADRYEHYLIRNVFKSGGVRIRSLQKQGWKHDRYAVTYMWRRSVDRNIYKIVATIWQGNLD